MRFSIFLSCVVAVGLVNCDGDKDTNQIEIVAESRNEDLTVASGEVLIVNEPTQFLSGASLVLESGASVRFDSDVILQISGDLIAHASSPGAITVASGLSSIAGGLRVDGSLVSLHNVNFRNLFIGLLSTADSTVVFSCVYDSCDTGVWTQDNKSYLSDLEVSGSFLGIKAESVMFELDDSRIADCETGVVLVGSGGSISNCDFVDNVWGINSLFSDSTWCLNNSFNGNKYGIRYYYGTVRFQGNHCLDNEIHVFLSAYPRHTVDLHLNNFLYSDSSAVHILPRNWNNPHSIDISDNFWDSIDSDEISSRIYDGVDHQPCDTLKYLPFSTSLF